MLLYESLASSAIDVMSLLLLAVTIRCNRIKGSVSLPRPCHSHTLALSTLTAAVVLRTACIRGVTWQCRLANNFAASAEHVRSAVWPAPTMSAKYNATPILCRKCSASPLPYGPPPRLHRMAPNESAEGCRCCCNELSLT